MSAWQIGALTLAAALLTASLTGLSIRYARRSGLLDQPGLRRSHTIPTPRGGGIAIGLTVVLTVLLLPLPAVPAWTLAFSFASVALIGWVDDHRSLPVWPRLLVHVLAAVGLCIGLLNEPWSAAVVPPISLFFLPPLIVAAINFCNFMDGINGIASSQAALVLAYCAALLIPAAPVWALFFALSAAACLGFLPFNFPRARIFLGDVGSGSLGLLVAAALIQVWWQAQIPAPALLLLVSAFAVDASLTLLQRMVQGKRWYRPHREHLYQWWVRSGQSHAEVTARYAAWTLVMAALLLIGRHWSTSTWILLSGGMYASAGALWLLGKRQVLRTAKRRALQPRGLSGRNTAGSSQVRAGR